MRDLFTQNTDIRMSLIVLSRRNIAGLEQEAADMQSTFHGVFGNAVNVTGFDEQDYERYLEILKNNHADLSEKALADIEYYGGRSPFTLLQIGNYLCEHPDGALDKFAGAHFGDYYKDLLNILKDQNYYKKLLQIVIGPKFDVTLSDLNVLVNMGYIYSYHENGETLYRCISEDFTRYLRETAERDDKAAIWPNLDEAVQRLREIIKAVLSGRFGERWEDEARRLFPERKLYQVDSFQRNNEAFYSGHDRNMLQVLSILDLSRIIDRYWDKGMRERFPTGADKNDWLGKFAALHNARIPLAHVNAQFLSPEQIAQANKYCDEIRALRA
jgi:hypothetical protein